MSSSKHINKPGIYWMKNTKEASLLTDLPLLNELILSGFWIHPTASVLAAQEFVGSRVVSEYFFLTIPFQTFA